VVAEAGKTIADPESIIAVVNERPIDEIFLNVLLIYLFLSSA